jgi:hypothetical protein
MLTRRLLLAGLALAVPAVAAAAGPDDPAAFVLSLYDRLAKTRGTSKPDFWQEPKGRTGVFSKEVVGLWKKAEDKAESDGEIGPIDFDVFANAQDVRAGKPTASVTDVDAVKAHVRVSLPVPAGKTATADDVLVFSLIKEGGGWRIDNLHGSAGGDPWDLRGLLTMQ